MQSSCNWKTCSGFNNYEVSTTGLIRNATTKRLLSGVTRKYIEVCLCQDNKQVTQYLHILIARTFIPNPYNLPQVNHKDGNKLNNNIENLEWCTCKDNIAHAWKTGLSKPCYKSRNACDKGTNRKLTLEDVRYIRKNYVRGTNQNNPGNGKELCKKFNITEGNLSHIITGRNWKLEDL